MTSHLTDIKPEVLKNVKAGNINSYEEYKKRQHFHNISQHFHNIRKDNIFIQRHQMQNVTYYWSGVDQKLII